MAKPLLVVVLSVAISICMTPGIAAEDVGTGTIQGKLLKFRSPEDAVVYIEHVPGEHPPPEEPARMDQVKLEFVPHILPIVKGTAVRFHNSDPVSHDVTWPACCEGAYASHSLGMWDQGIVRDFTYDTEGKITLLCKIHPRMEAHVVVLQNPYYSLGNEQGAYVIENVPPGEYLLMAWFPKLAKRKPMAVNVTVAAGEITEQDFSR